MPTDGVLLVKFACEVGKIGLFFERPLPLAQLMLSLSMDTVTEGQMSVANCLGLKMSESL